jgi:hypothetical protein
MAQVDAIRGDVDLFYRSYIETFNRGDAAGMLPYLAIPFVMVTGATATSFDDEKASVALYERIYAGMRADDWSHSSVDMLEISPAGANGAILIVTAARHRKDGSVMTRGKACYSLLREPDGRWKAAAIIADFRGDFTAAE